MAAKKDTTPKTAGPAADKKAALETALAQIEKQFGKGAVMKLGANVTMQVDAIPTGSLGLDLALGIGGVPRGRIVEVYGPESSGKTTLALQILAEAQKMGGEVAFIDVEHRIAKGRDEAERIADKIYNREIDEEGFRRRTRSLYPYVAAVYGWKTRQRKPDKAA